MKSIVLAGGCFWGLEKFFSQFPGIQTQTGYANGGSLNPSYEQVCRGSGHTEAVQVDYPDDIDTAQILAAFFAVVDPTSLNRQGNDVGINYRSGIYYSNEQDARTAEIMIQDLQKHFDRPVVIEVLPLKDFSRAEDYHQKYLDKNPQGYCHLPRQILSGHLLPSMAMVQSQYPGLTAQ